MAAFVQSNKAASSSATSLNCSFLSNVAANGFLVAAGRIGATGRTTTVTDSFAGSYSDDLQKNDSGVTTTSYIAHKASAAGGADTVTTAISGAAASIRFTIHEYSGMGAATLGQTNSAALANTGVGVTAPSGNITTTSPNALIFGLVTDDNSGTNASWTVTSGWNARETVVASTACVYTDDLIVSATGTYANAPAPATATSNTPVSLVAAFVIPDVAVPSGVSTIRIPNANVGPMALRHLFRRALTLPPGTTTSPVSSTLGFVVEALQGIFGSAADPVEATSGIATTTSEPVEATSGLSTTSSEPVEATGGIAVTGSEPLEALQGLSAALTDPIESLAAAVTTAAEPIEVVQGIATTGTEPVEAAAGIATTALDPFEALQGIAAGPSDPIEAQGNTPVSQTVSLAIEALAGVVGAGVEAIESLTTAASALTEPYESLAAASRALAEPFESLAAATSSAAAPIEATQQLAKTLQTTFESLVVALVAIGLPIESAAPIAIAGIVATVRTRSNPGSGLTRASTGSGLTRSNPSDGRTFAEGGSGRTNADGGEGDTHTSIGGDA